MHVEFNYRYFEDEESCTDYHILMEECLDSKIAYSVEEVGNVIHFAENEQQKGYYVAVYIAYEAAPYFNKHMCVNTTGEAKDFSSCILIQVWSRCREKSSSGWCSYK